MKRQTLMTITVLLMLCTIGIPFVAHTSVVQQKPNDERPTDPRFVQMAKLKERNQRDARYASRLKAKFANDPKTLNTSRKLYETAKDKFDGWLTALGLAIVHKQEKDLGNDQFKQTTIEANKAAIDFEAYAERLTEIEEPNPLTGESATASMKSMENAKQATVTTAVGETSVTVVAAAAPPPSPIPIVAQIIVGIAFDVYKEHQKIKLEKRKALVDDMRAQISWKEWGDIKPDPDTEALPKPKPSPSASPTPAATPAAKPSPKPKPSAAP